MKQFKFSPSIIAIFLLLTLPAFIALISFVYISNDRMADSISSSLIERFKFETRLSVSDQINPARRLINSAAAVGSIRSALFDEAESLEYLKSILVQQENSLSTYVGKQDGSFRQVRRVQPGSRIQNKLITEEMKFGLRWIPKGSATDNYVFIGAENQRLDSSTAATTYDPRTRPWYKEAASRKKLTVTDPYIFSTTGLPGITVAAPFYDNKELAGVVAIDISLETLSEFLSSRAISGRSISVIYDSSGAVIASSVKADTFRKLNNRTELNYISSLSSNLPALAIAMRAGKDRAQLVLNHPENGEEYVAVFSSMPEDFEKRWNILSLTPVDDFKGEFDRNNRVIFHFGIALMLAQVLLIYLYARKISRPLERITASIQGLIEFKPPENSDIRTNIYELSALASALKKLVSTITAFTSYIPRDLVNDLLGSGKPIEIGGESRYLTILFTDLRDFSSLSETTPTRELLRRVSSYFELMTLAIKEQNGTVDKFIGDAVMAFWGAPLLDERHAYHACVAAIKSRRRMDRLNSGLIAEGKPPLYVRIGIHSDAVLVGNIGSAERLSYTVMGDGVNIASRLEGVNKEYGTQICVSHSVFKEAGERLWLRPIDQISVKGRRGELRIYELVGTRDGSDETQPTEAQKMICELTEKAFGVYLEKDYAGAEAIYREILQIGADTVAEVMINKCRCAGAERSDAAV